MTLLDYAKDICDEIGIEPPSSVVNNDDDDARRLLSLFNSEGKRLMRRYEWQELTVEKVFVAVAGEDQGLMSTLAPDFDRLIADTLHNRTDRRQRHGSESAQDWQAEKARNINVRPFKFRLRGGHLLMNPAAGAGDSIAFEYVSGQWVLATNGTTTKEAFTVDTDTSRLDSDILKLGVKWRYLKVIGGDWQPDFQEYKEQLRLRFGADAPQGVIDMNDSADDRGGVRIMKS